MIVYNISILKGGIWMGRKKKIKIDLVVSRHQGLIDFLKEKGFINNETKIIDHISDPEEIRGKVVLGNLPFHLSSLTKLIITPILEVPVEMRGKDLSKEEVEKVFKGFGIFEVIDRTSDFNIWWLK